MAGSPQPSLPAPVRLRVQGRQVLVHLEGSPGEARSAFAEAEELARLLPGSSTVLDVGANVGLFSLYLLARGHRVVSFEASPRHAALLRASREANGFRSWEIVEAAVAEQAGTLRFAPAGPFGHVAGEDAPEASDLVEVPALALGEWLNQTGPGRVHLVKMDIEGSEPAALRGMADLLSRPDAPLLYVESNGHCLAWFGSHPGALKQLLAGFGYHLVLIRPPRPLRPRRYVRVRPEELQASTVENYLCVKDLSLLGRVDERGIPEARKIAQLLKAARSPANADRGYVARALRSHPRYAEDPRVAAALDELKRDRDPVTAAQAAWWRA